MLENLTFFSLSDEYFPLNIGLGGKLCCHNHILLSGLSSCVCVGSLSRYTCFPPQSKEMQLMGLIGESKLPLWVWMVVCIKKILVFILFIFVLGFVFVVFFSLCALLSPHNLTTWTFQSCRTNLSSLKTATKSILDPVQNSWFKTEISACFILLFFLVTRWRKLGKSVLAKLPKVAEWLKQVTAYEKSPVLFFTTILVPGPSSRFDSVSKN